MIDEPRLDAYRRIVDHSHSDEDIDDISRQIEELRSERHRRVNGQSADFNDQWEGQNMNSMADAQLDHGQALEVDPFAQLTDRELEELDLAPEEIDFTALSPEQQVRYWSLLSPGEKLCMVRLHLQADRDEIARRLQLPTKILKHLEGDKFTFLPATPATIRSYYRAYAEELGIEPEQLILQYEALTGHSKAHQERKGFSMLTSFRPWQRKFMWGTAAAFLIGVVLILYAVRGSWMTPAPSALSTGQWDIVDEGISPEPPRPIGQ